MLEYYKNKLLDLEYNIADLKAENLELTQHVYDLLQEETPEDYKRIIKQRVFK